MSYQHIIVDDPHPCVRRITMNRPAKRNALNNRMRSEIFEALEDVDRDGDASISILRGAGSCFSASYDLSSDNRIDQPYHSASGPGQWSRHVVEGWFRIWDLAKPVIAQVPGNCLAGGTELATACDVVYVADDAQIGYPPVRLMSPPDNAVSSLAGRHAPRHGIDADRRCDVGTRSRRMGLYDAMLPARGSRRKDAQFRRARRQGANRVAAAEQAQRAPCNGDHGGRAPQSAPVPTSRRLPLRPRRARPTWAPFAVMVAA